MDTSYWKGQLCFTLLPRKGHTDEKVLLKTLLHNRDVFACEMVARIQLVLSALAAQQDYEPSVNMRLAGFATLLIKLMRQGDDLGEAEAYALLGDWKQEQVASVFANNDLVEALTLWMRSNTFRPREELAAGELLNRLKPYISGQPKWGTSPFLLGRMLSRSANAFRNQFGLGQREDKHLKYNVYWFNPPFTLESEPIVDATPVTQE